MKHPFLTIADRTQIKPLDSMEYSDWKEILKTIQAKPYAPGDFLICCMPTMNGSHLTNNLSLTEKTFQPLLLKDPSGKEYVLVLAGDTGLVFSLEQNQVKCIKSRTTLQDAVDAVLNSPVHMFSYQYYEDMGRFAIGNVAISNFKGPFLMVLAKITKNAYGNGAVSSSVYLADEGLQQLRKLTFASFSFSALVSALQKETAPVVMLEENNN